MGRPSRFAVPVLAAGACILLTAPPAGAHPFGPPPTARVSAEGAVITVAWTATPDDAVAIGEHLGVMPPGSIAAYRQESAAQVAPSARDEAALSASPLLADYLLEHIGAVQDGTPCEGDVPPIADFVHEGAVVTLTCAAPVTQVDLRLTMLHELHPAYRTFAIGMDSAPGESVFTVQEPEQSWRFGEAPTPAGFGMAAGIVAGVAVLGLAGLGWRRLRHARRGR